MANAENGQVNHGLPITSLLSVSKPSSVVSRNVCATSSHEIITNDEQHGVVFVSSQISSMHWSSNLPHIVFFDCIVLLSVLMQLIAWKDLCLKWPVMCRVELCTLPSRYLWNKLPKEHGQPVDDESLSSHLSLTSSSSSSSPLSLCITSSHFHSRLKTYLFSQILLTIVSLTFSDRPLRFLWPVPDLVAHRFLFLNFFCLICVTD